VIPDHIERILDAARTAPSRDNRQPWRFVLDGNVVSFAVDPARDLSPMNAGDRMARLAVGAALESALLRAGRMGAVVKVLPPRAGALVTVSIGEAKRFPDPDKGFVRRATSRRVYDARPLDDASVAALREATQPLETTRTHWFGRERVRALGPIVEEVEAVFLGQARLREAALEALRFDVRDREEVAHGLSLGSLELTGPERIAMDALRRAPTVGVVAKLAARERRLVESASGVCVVTTKGTDAMADVNAGRAMQRAWLALARRGMTAQPMSTVPCLDAMLEATDGIPFDPAQRERVSAASAAFRAAFPSVEKDARIAIWMRVGWGDAPAVRAGRRPLEESVALEEGYVSSAPAPLRPPP
jgi:nitroreductase